MSTETNALRAVENDVPEKQITQCRKILVAVEKGETNLSARLFEAIRKMMRSIEKSRGSSSDEKLEAIALLTRLKKTNRTKDQDDVQGEAPTAISDGQSSVDAHDCLRAQSAVLGHNWVHRMPLKWSDREALLAALLPDITVPVVQKLILDMRRPDERGSRLSSYREIFSAAQQYLADHGAEELPREVADLEYDGTDKNFIERMRERGVEGY